LVLVQGRSILTGEPLPATPVDLVRALFTRKLDVYAELRAQIEKIAAAGIQPSHLDAHKHTHIVPTVFRAVVRLADEFRIPFVRLPIDKSSPPTRTVATGLERWFRRLARQHRVSFTDHFVGFRLTGSLNERTLIAALRHIPEGITEFMCHPGYLGSDLNKAATRLKRSRVAELEALTSPKVRALLAEESIRLATFRDGADLR
jgi:predicted glycoside hydrolase/deacetylase ChbG (UPF0249 family)